MSECTSSTGKCSSTSKNGNEIDTSIAKNANWIIKAFEKCKDSPNDWVHCQAIQVSEPENSASIDNSKNSSLNHCNSKSEQKNTSSKSTVAPKSTMKSFTKSSVEHTRKNKEFGNQTKTKKSAMCDGSKTRSDRNK